MNERIKELQEKAWVYATTCNERYAKPTTQLYDEKFAELIVNECFDVVIKDCRFNDCKGIIRGACALAKEHFGVE